MAFLPLGPFRPDQPDTVPGRLADLLNASLMIDGDSVAYGPAKGHLLTTSTPQAALSSGVRGSLTCVTSGGAYIVIIMTSTTILLLDADGTVSTLGSGYNLPAGDRWGACQFGKYALFSNLNDGMLQYDVELGGAVTAVSGAPKARILATVFDSLFALNCDGENRLMRYSSINDHTNWTTGTSGYQPMPDGEELQGIGEVTDGTALVIQRNAVRVLYRNDTISMFSMRKPVAGKGSVNPWCIVPVNGGIYFIDTNGFQFANSEGLVPIGRGKVDQWWLNELDTDGFADVQGAYDAERDVIRWIYRKAGVDVTYFQASSRGIDFDIATGEFVPMLFGLYPAEIFTTATPALTMEDLDAYGTMDNLGDLSSISLDDRFYFGGDPKLGAIFRSLVVATFYFPGYFDGDNLAALFETTTLSDNETSRITFIRPVTDAATVEVQVGRSQRLQDAISYDGAAAGIQPSGRIAVSPPTMGKNHRIKATIDAADDTFTYIRGFEDVKYTQPGGPK